MLVGAVGSVAALPFGVLFLTASSAAVSLAALLAMNVFMTAWLPPAYAVMHGTVPNRMRGLMTALMLMGQSLVGAGLGPFLVGYVSDELAPSWGSRSIQPAMALGVIAFVAAAILCFSTAKILDRANKRSRSAGRG
jgi:MFS family permease